MRSEPRVTGAVELTAGGFEELLQDGLSIPNDLPRGGHRGAGRLHIVTFAAPEVLATSSDGLSA
jgi:hypothetical protein